MLKKAERQETMYTENEFMTPRERVNDSLLRRLQEEANREERLEGMEVCPLENRPNVGERRSWGLDGYPLASMFAPLQEWRSVYEPELGMSRGTIFKELDLPFVCGDRRGGGCNGR